MKKVLVLILMIFGILAVMGCPKGGSDTDVNLEDSTVIATADTVLTSDLDTAIFQRLGEN